MNLFALLAIAGATAIWLLRPRSTTIDLGKVSAASVKDAIRREERRGYDAPVGKWPPRKVAEDLNR